jgi:hypothetical protein
MMLSVEVADPLAAGVAEAGFNEHDGANAGAGSTEQVNCTSLLNPFVELMVTVEVAECPAAIEAGEAPAAESEKSGFTTNAGVTL